MERWGKIAAPLTVYGYDVFVVDYRGYGKSTGKRTESLMYKDAQLCFDYLKQAYDEKSIVVYGRSLGGTFATYVAAKNNPKQLILEATFSSMQDVISHKLPFLPYSKILNFKFKTFELIEKVTVPTLIFHGKKDRLVSFKLAEKVVAHANKEFTKFVEIDEASHHTINQYDAYKKTLEIELNK